MVKDPKKHDEPVKLLPLYDFKPDPKVVEEVKKIVDSLAEKKYRLGNRLTEDEVTHLKECLSSYRVEKQKINELKGFYDQMINLYGFDAFGRFTHYSEMGMERTTWEIQNELGDGSNYNFIGKAEGDKLTLVDKLGQKKAGPIILTADETSWSDYFEMCSKLKIDPNSYGHYAGLTFSDEFNELWNENPELLQKIKSDPEICLDDRLIRTKVKDWFYFPNQEIKLKRPIDIYRKDKAMALSFFLGECFK